MYRKRFPRQLMLGALPALVFAVAAAPCPAQTAQRVRWLQGYDEYVVQAMAGWRVPGAAIAIVRNDSVILARGYGVRKLGDPSPVGPGTIFAVGSTTKAFTAALLGRLVDEGKLAWDDPVRDHLPDFEMYDPVSTRSLTVRDLLTHRSGLSAGDNIWYGNAISRREIVRRLRYFKPSWPLRSTYSYQNMMFVAAGLVVEALRGYSWEAAIEREIFAPLGMTASRSSSRALAEVTDVAQPHLLRNDTVQVIPRRNIDNAGPAGSITSNVVDMAKWVRLQLDSGKVAGKSVVSPAFIAESHTPQTVIRRQGPWANALSRFNHYQSYGLGWVVYDYRGREVVSHGGNIDGMSAMVGFMPEERIGVVILTNLNQTPLVDALLWHTFDRFVADSPRDWSAEMLSITRGSRSTARAAEQKREASRVKNTNPSIALERYAGVYSDSLYGDLDVRVEDGHLVARYGSAFTGDLAHWHYDTFQAAWRDPMLGRSLVTFSLDRDGNVAGVTVERLTEFRRSKR